MTKKKNTTPHPARVRNFPSRKVRSQTRAKSSTSSTAKLHRRLKDAGETFERRLEEIGGDK